MLETEASTPAPPSTDVPPPDAERQKAVAVLAYLLFFLPLLVARESAFAMFHANQGLNLLMLFVVVNVIGTFVPVIGWFIIGPLGNIFAFLLLVVGMVNAGRGTTKPLPFIGKYHFLKV